MGNKNASGDAWASGDLYEAYVGRWSRLVAREFIPWVGLSENKRWLDVGCGTGALSQTILDLAHPQNVKGIDRSESFVELARRKTDHSRAEFEVGDAQALRAGIELCPTTRPDDL
jgi:ubiquinone/menaquinone biosynthesis C-methylase UbiE